MLRVALRFKLVTLGVMLATVALTGVLFVVIPKGFFPQQDTGLITSVTAASADVSLDQMANLQRAVIDHDCKGPGSVERLPVTLGQVAQRSRRTTADCSSC